MNAALKCSDAEVMRWNGVLGNSACAENRVSARSVCQDQPAQYLVRNSSDRLHSSRLGVPSLPNKHGAEDMQRASERTTRNLRVSRNEIADRIRLAVNNAIPQHVEPAKAAAQKIECSPRTVEALRQRIPDAMVTVGMLGLAYPEFAIAMAEMWGISVDDPKGYAMFIAMQRHAMEKVK